MNQHENIFNAQLEKHTKGDWVSEMERLIVEIEIASSFKEIMTMKKSKFEKIVTEKLKAEAFDYLKNKV